MRYLVIAGVIISLFACKSKQQAVADKAVEEVKEVVENKEVINHDEVGATASVVPKDMPKFLIQENELLRMNRTPCFGSCPTFSIIVMQDGHVKYHGKKFAKKVGVFQGRLSEGDMAALKKEMDNVSIFEFKDVYDAKVTDLPACVIEVNYRGKRKRIYDRMNAPEKLKDFELFIERIVISDKLNPME